MAAARRSAVFFGERRVTGQRRTQTSADQGETCSVKPTDCSVVDNRSLDDKLKLDVCVRDIRKLYAVEDRMVGRANVERVSILIHALGGDGKAYKRERAKAARQVVSEVYSAPRVTATARRLPKYGLGPGVALDLTDNDDDDALQFQRRLTISRLVHPSRRFRLSIRSDGIRETSNGILLQGVYT